MTCEDRTEEAVRPIFWSIKPKSYVSQTHSWEDFPNGRWSSSNAATFSLTQDVGFTSFSKKQSADPEARRAMWGEEITKVANIVEVFKKFIQKSIKKFPFSEGPISAESVFIKDTLVTMNENKLLTINSQP